MAVGLTMSWQALTAISVACLSSVMLLQRVLLARDKIDPIAYVIVFQGSVGILTLIGAIAHGFSFPDLRPVWLPALACTVLYAAGHIVYAKTLQRVEASVFAVLFATHVLWMSLIGVVWFHEQLRLIVVIGTGLLFGSTCILIKNARGFRLDRGVLLGLLTGVLFGLAITCWGYVGRQVSDPLSWSALSFLAPAALVLAVRPSAVSAMGTFLHKRIMQRMMALAILYAVGCGAMLFAYKYGAFSVVSPLRQAGVVVTVLLAFLFLRQERTHVVRKLIAAAVCFVGVLCLV